MIATVGRILFLVSLVAALGQNGISMQLSELDLMHCCPCSSYSCRDEHLLGVDSSASDVKAAKNAAVRTSTGQRERGHLKDHTSPVLVQVIRPEVPPDTSGGGRVGIGSALAQNS